jgi:ribosomal protein L16 Arg81 hydroxylase
MNAFSHLLAPLSPEEFLSEFWTRKSVLISGEDTKFADLFAWNNLNQLLNRSRLFFPRLRLVRDKSLLPEAEFTSARLGDPEHLIDSAKVITHLRNGATLIFDGVNESDAKVEQMVNDLRFELGESVHVNLYCSSSGVQGFDLHYDPHEVFLLQIAGQKSWQVYDCDRRFPLRYEKPANSSIPSQSYLQAVLSPGDVLYIPRGHWHAGIATQGPSLHLTLAVTCRTGISFLQWVIEELRSEEAWRQNLPLALRGDNTVDEVVARLEPRVEDLSQSLISFLSSVGIAERYAEHCIGKERSDSPFNLPLHYSAQTIELTMRSSFSRPATQKASIRKIEDSTAVKVVVWGKELVFRGRVDKWVERLFSTISFTGEEAAAWQEDLAWDDVRPVLLTLVKEGILLAKDGG